MGYLCTPVRCGRGTWYTGQGTAQRRPCPRPLTENNVPRPARKRRISGYGIYVKALVRRDLKYWPASVPMEYGGLTTEGGRKKGAGGPLVAGYVNLYLGGNVEVLREHVGFFQLVDQVHQVFQGTFEIVGRKVHFRRPNRFDQVLPAGLFNEPGVDGRGRGGGQCSEG